MRLFVAVMPPPEVRCAARVAAEEATRGLNSIRWTKQGNIHLTLKFLGEVPEESLQDVCDALEKSCSVHAPFDASLGGLGAFPSPRRAQVIWAGMDEGSGEMSALAAEIEAALKPLGFQREERPYVPHTTLGRTRGKPLSIELPDTSIAGIRTFRVERVDLVRSTLTPGGPIYGIVETFSLSGAEGSYSR